MTPRDRSTQIIILPCSCSIFGIIVAGTCAIAIKCMADSNGAAVEETAKPGALLEPLPTLKLVPEKLDAGLRSFDHCKDHL